MKLQEGQLEQFERDGYIIIPELFSQEDVSILKAEVPKVFAQKREENVREKDGQTVRTSFATHTYNKLFSQFVRHPNVLKAAEAAVLEMNKLKNFHLLLPLTYKRILHKEILHPLLEFSSIFSHL